MGIELTKIAQYYVTNDGIETEWDNTETDQKSSNEGPKH